ncbi:unannotated protein [freshwater metagenome]
MSEHPDLMSAGEFDLVGFAVGIVERSKILPQRVAAGDQIIGFASPGLRSNGYSLARRALLDRAGRSLQSPAWSGAHHSLGEELLRPSAIYAPAMSALNRRVDVHAFAHVTGGGIGGNLERVLPSSLDGVIRRGVWDEPRIFAEVQAAGDISDDEMQRTFNLGLGMLAVLPAGEVEAALDSVRASGHQAWLVGEIVNGSGRAHITSP